VVGLFGQRVKLGQANGPDVDLIVSGTELYANYETPDGYPAVYDDSLGLFTYARVADGRFQSTGVPVTSAPPPGLQKHAKESDAVRAEKFDERTRDMELRSQVQRKGHEQ
jgi:hypothetical protein